MRAWALVALLIPVAGCLQEEPAPVIVPATFDGVVRMDVPVPVFLLAAGDAKALQERLQPITVSDGVLAARAVFGVYTPDAAWRADFDAFLDAARIPQQDLTGFDGAVFDGNAIEAYLHDNLGAIHPVPDGITSLVILEPGVAGHAYHYAGDVGWREPVRSFGERHGLLAWDPSAEVDPWVGDAQDHHTPGASVEVMAQWVERATAIRALQMPIWPPAVKDCHAVTIILAVRGTTVTPAFGLQSWQDTLDVPRLQATFQNLTGDPVHVDLVVKMLPEDDPPLELATRENNARLITQTYLDLNFDDYHVPHEGCEPYLSLVVYGDLADQRTSSNGNAAMSINGKRISTSLVAENVRVMTESIGYNDVWDESTDFERVGPGADPHEWFNWVVSHETGHLFSLPHPNAGGGFSDTGFASTWNVMGYQMRRIVTEMGQVDTHNLQRNQAAHAIASSHLSEARLAPALEAMGAYQWKQATHIALGHGEET